MLSYTCEVGGVRWTAELTDAALENIDFIDTSGFPSAEPLLIHSTVVMEMLGDRIAEQRTEIRAAHSDIERLKKLVAQLGSSVSALSDFASGLSTTNTEP